MYDMQTLHAGGIPMFRGTYLVSPVVIKLRKFAIALFVYWSNWFRITGIEFGLYYNIAKICFVCHCLHPLKVCDVINEVSCNDALFASFKSVWCNK